MEENERYEVMSPSLNGYAYIHDFKTDNVLNTFDSCELLNQQDKENQQLKQQLHKLPKKIVEEIKDNVDLKELAIYKRALELACHYMEYEYPKKNDDIYYRKERELEMIFMNKAKKELEEQYVDDRELERRAYMFYESIDNYINKHNVSDEQVKNELINILREGKL